MGSILPASPHPTAWHSFGPRGIPLLQTPPMGEKETGRTSTAFTTEGPRSSHHHHGHLQLSPPRTPAGRPAHSPCHRVLPKQELFLHPPGQTCHTFSFLILLPLSPGATAWVPMPPDTDTCAPGLDTKRDPLSHDWLTGRGGGGEEIQKIQAATTEHLQYN